MQIFEEIQAILSQQKPFVCYVKPNETVWNLLSQENNKAAKNDITKTFFNLTLYQPIQYHKQKLNASVFF